MYSEYFDRMRKKFDKYNSDYTEWYGRSESAKRESKSEAEYDAWYAQNPPPNGRVRDGEIKAMEAYEFSSGIGSDVVILNRDIGTHSVPWFVNALRKAGFKEFVLTHSDVNTLDRLDDFVLEGCRLGDLVQILTAKNEPGKRSYARTGIEIKL